MLFKKILRNNFFRQLLIFLLSFLSVVNKLIPKKQNAILFYDGTSPVLRDNSEALLSYLINNGFNEKYQICMCVPNNKNRVVDGIKNLKVIGGVFAFLRFKYIFFSFGDMRIAPTGSQCVINMFHGIAFKKIGKLSTDVQYQNEKLNSFSYVVATSEWFKPFVAKEFDVDEDKVFINGNCRCDYLYSKENIVEKFDFYCENIAKYVLWMPTFRISKSGRFNDSVGFSSETGLPVISSWEKMSELNEFCSKNNICLVIKAHNAMQLSESTKFSNIIFLNDLDIEAKGAKLYEFVKDFDGLITDYSSIFIDYLLLNRPIAFTIDDIENYKEGRGFIVEDPTIYMPGRKIINNIDFQSFLHDLLVGDDLFGDERKIINDLFNKHKKDFCLRLLEFAGINK